MLQICSLDAKPPRQRNSSLNMPAETMETVTINLLQEQER